MIVREVKRREVRQLRYVAGYLLKLVVREIESLQAVHPVTGRTVRQFL